MIEEEHIIMTKRQYTKFNMLKGKTKELRQEIAKGGPIDWAYISHYVELSERFIEDYHRELDWFNISRYQLLSSRIIDKFTDRICWTALSSNPRTKITLSLLGKYKDKLDWTQLCMNQNLTEAQMSRFVDYLDWYGVSLTQRFAMQFIYDNSDKLIFTLIPLNKKSQLTKSILTKYGDQMGWMNLLTNNRLSLAQISYYSDKLDWTYISRHIADKNFVEKFATHIDTNALMFNEHISFSPEEIKKYFSEFRANKYNVNRDFREKEIFDGIPNLERTVK